ncbi:MAG TPA: hypothetical protein DEQ38_04595 [Elusimicrobia bacterium]|nr:MAG: hypothetical protein A2089_00560 [Elusimicrobia bacterium GWD2_63_28]HCC47380.1 hypothetical protein [Elusimicrobiota bacterium]
MITIKFFIPVLACILACACLPPKKAVQPAAAPQRAAAAVKLSPEQLKKVDQLYYKAVGSFSNNDMPAASAHLKEIFSINPAHKPALELRDKIRLSGYK